MCPLLSALACQRRSAATTEDLVGDARRARRSGPTRIACGEFACAQYDSPPDASVTAIVSGPLVLGIGETHVPRGASVPSAARYFTDDLLHRLAPRASDLLLELMMSPGDCPDASIEVRTKQQVFTSRQAQTNPSEYVTMGEPARALGIVPDMLRPAVTTWPRCAATGETRSTRRSQRSRA
jgi:hypothetical protein